MCGCVEEDEGRSGGGEGRSVGVGEVVGEGVDEGWVVRDGGGGRERQSQGYPRLATSRWDRGALERFLRQPHGHGSNMAHAESRCFDKEMRGANSR